MSHSLSGHDRIKATKICCLRIFVVEKKNLSTQNIKTKCNAKNQGNQEKKETRYENPLKIKHDKYELF